jgi:hypothetical protein
MARVLGGGFGAGNAEADVAITQQAFPKYNFCYFSHDTSVIDA